MLNSLRSAADNIIFRILLGVIVIAFALWGIGDVLRSNNDVELIKFKNIPSIKLSEFYHEKTNLVKQIQDSSKEEITEDLLSRMNIDNQVVVRLMNKRLTEGWIDMEKIMISDKLIADYIKRFPQFYDENKNFSVKIFKKFLATRGMDEEEFYRNIKFDIANSLLKQTIISSIHTPKLMNDIMSYSLSQIKTVDLIKVDLKEKRGLNISLSEENIEDFYKKNKEEFKLPEEREISYIIIESKTSEPNLLKNLEDSVAAGDNLKEISDKYKTSIKTVSGSFEKLEKNNIVSKNISQIFELQEKELSYPFEIEDNKSYVIYEVNFIKEGRIPPLKDIKKKVSDLALENSIALENIKKLKEFESKLEKEDFYNLAKSYGYNISQITIQKNNKNLPIPVEVVDHLFNINQGEISSLMADNNNGYIAKIAKVSLDKKQFELVQKTHLSEIEDNFKHSFLDSIFNYIYIKNEPDLKLEILRKENQS